MGQTIRNHGHVLFPCSEVSDKAIHLPDEKILQFVGRCKGIN